MIVDSDRVLNTPLNYFYAEVHRMSTKRSAEPFFSAKLSDNSKIVTVLYYRNRSKIKKEKAEQWSNTSLVIQSDSSNCNFWKALIAPKIGLLHAIRSFYTRNPESYAAFRLLG